MRLISLLATIAFAILSFVVTTHSAYAEQSSCDYGPDFSSAYEARVNAQNANCPLELVNYLRASKPRDHREVIFGDLVYEPLNRTVVRVSFRELSDKLYPRPRLSRFLSGIAFVGKDRGKRRYELEHKKAVAFKHPRFGECTAKVHFVAAMTLENACTTFAGRSGDVSGSVALKCKRFRCHFNLLGSLSALQ